MEPTDAELIADMKRRLNGPNTNMYIFSLLSNFLYISKRDRDGVLSSLRIYDDNEEVVDILAQQVFMQSEEQRLKIKDMMKNQVKPLRALFDLEPVKIKNFWNRNINYCCRQGCIDRFTYKDFGKCRWRYWSLGTEEERRRFIYNKLESFIDVAKHSLTLKIFGVLVCQKTFLLMYGFSKKKFYSQLEALSYLVCFGEDLTFIHHGRGKAKSKKTIKCEK